MIPLREVFQKKKKKLWKLSKQGGGGSTWNPKFFGGILVNWKNHPGATRNPWNMILSVKNINTGVGGVVEGSNMVPDETNSKFKIGSYFGATYTWKKHSIFTKMCFRCWRTVFSWKKWQIFSWILVSKLRGGRGGVRETLDNFQSFVFFFFGIAP